MAKEKVTISYSKAEVSVDDDAIIEIAKEETRVHSLSEFLNKLVGKENVTISASYDSELEPKSLEY